MHYCYKIVVPEYPINAETPVNPRFMLYNIECVVISPILHKCSFFRWPAKRAKKY